MDETLHNKETEQEDGMMKKMSMKKLAGIAAGIAAAVVVVAVAAVLVLRIDAAEAQQIALELSGGGEIQSQGISSEGLWNEYDYLIANGDTWYDIEINGFGVVTEMESGTGQYRDR